MIIIIIIISAQLPGAQPMRHTVEELLGNALINERFIY